MAQTDGIELVYREWGLCLLGIGLSCFRECGRLLMQILEQVLPMSESWIAGITDIIRSSAVDGVGANGFAFLFRIMRDLSAIPLLKDKGVYPENPKWPENDSIFVWAKRVHVHCCIMRIHGITIDQLEASCLFLDGLQGPLYTQCAMGYTIVVLVWSTR